MHRGTLLAGLVIGLLVAGLAAWMVMSPLIVSTYAATMRNPRTGATVECRVTAEEREHPLYAFHICMMACGYRGFEPVGQVDHGGIPEFFGPPEEYRKWRARKLKEFARFIPAACRDGHG